MSAAAMPDDDVVVLVDAAGRALGTADRLAAHRPPGLLHAAISVVVANAAGQVLIQRRAPTKPLFAARWSNSCCTHPAPGESPVAAAERRALEELGMHIADVREAGSFVYHAVDPNSGLVELEHDTVLVARAADEPAADPREVLEWTWIDLPSMRAAPIGAHDDGCFTPWAHDVHAIGSAWWRAHDRTHTTTGGIR